MCLVCRTFGPGPVCRSCRDGLRPAGDRLVDGRVVVRSAFGHEGPARTLVHRLKYDGIPAAGAVLAAAMAPLLPADAAALVPVPRVVVRRVGLGVDPGRELAAALAVRTGLPLLPVLGASLAGPRHAGRRRRDRRPPVFRRLGEAPAGAVLVDDVVTTGLSLASAAAALRIGRPEGGVTTAVTATAAGTGHPAGD